MSVVTMLLLAACGSGNDKDAGTGKEPIVQYKETKLACSNGWNQYKVADTSMQFCYLPAWGEPVLEAMEATKGSLNKISFSNAENAPSLWYLSDDYEGDGSRPVDFCFSCLRITASNEELQAQMEEELGRSNFTARKTDVGAARAMRISGDDLSFYIPNAFEGHHVLITGPSSMSEELDNFAFDMLF